MRVASARPANHAPPPNMPEAWVLKATHLLPRRGRVIDLACGNGRHGRWFHANDHQVTFVDHDTSQVDDLRGVRRTTVLRSDLEADDLDPASILEPGAFAGVIVVNYLWRPLLPAIVAAVAPGGVLVYQTFAAGNQRFGKPSNPDYLLASGELLEASRGHLEVLRYEHGEDLIDRPAMVQRIMARRPR